MIVPQPTAQYGHVDRVSLALAIFRLRSSAKAGCKSKPKTAAAAPPTVATFRKSLRDAFISPPMKRKVDARPLLIFVYQVEVKLKSDERPALQPFAGFFNSVPLL